MYIRFAEKEVFYHILTFARVAALSFHCVADSMACNAGCVGGVTAGLIHCFRDLALHFGRC